MIIKEEIRLIIVHSDQEPPRNYSKAIFLAGPTPRSKSVKSWRPRALKILERLGYDGVVFIPETSNGEWKHQYLDQVEAEERFLNMADCIVFWVPRKLETMPGFTTNDEWGVWKNSGKVVLGAPKYAKKMGYLRYYAEKLGVPYLTTLADTLTAAVKMVGKGALRRDGERDVPLHIWKTIHFQSWYQSLKRAGNRLDGARVKWSSEYGAASPFLFVLHANIYVASENRNKTNEVVISRPDISTVVLYRKDRILDESDIVIIREFRTPNATSDGFVSELPGGSSPNSRSTPEEIAVEECAEEVGLMIDPSRFKQHDVRQLMATLSSHKAHLFSVEISPEELEKLKSMKGIAHGLAHHSERTYVEVMKLREIRQNPNIDWSMLGMILSVVR